MKQHFHWRTLTALFVEPIQVYLGLALLFAVFAWIILKFVAYMFQTPFLKYEYYTYLIVFLPILILPVYHLYVILITWYAQRRDFTEAEHIFILLVIAIYSSMIFGAINYSLYRLDKSSFSVDERIVKKEYNEYLLSNQQRLDEAKRVADGSDKIIAELTKLERTTFKRSGNYYFFSNPKRYTFDTNIPGLTIYYVETTTSSEGASVTDYTLEADAWGQKLVIDPEAQLGAREILKPFTNDTVTRDDLVKVFQYQADWERKSIISPVEVKLKSAQESGDAGFPVPMTLFVYQAAMDALNASPRYFNPSSFLTRLMAFVYAFLRYIYFGVFVSVVAKGFVSPTAKANDEGSKVDVPIPAE
jgi:hypothetical protein